MGVRGEARQGEITAWVSRGMLEEMSGNAVTDAWMPRTSPHWG